MEPPAVSPIPCAPPPALSPWPDLPGVANGFFGRAGGVSAGPFATLNLSYLVGDMREAVDENWRRARRLIGTAAVARLSQVHGSDVRIVTRDETAAVPRGDAMVTVERGVVLGIFTADCVPVLMVDPDARVAGAIHAGWRGTLAGIAEAGVRAMVSAGADRARIRAALGPSIGQCCFEVDAELAERFERQFDGAGAYRRAGRPGKAYLALRAIVADQLRRAGLDPDGIVSAGPCTRCAAEEYFSRRAAGGATSGLQLSFVGFAP